MKFFKKNSYEIVRLFLNQFALAVFGIVLVTAARKWKDGSFNWLTLVVSIFSILFYLYILYATLLEMGMKHKIKIDNGTLQADKHYGLKIMLFAQVPNFIILILMFFGWLFGYAVASGKFAQGMYGIMQIIMYFLQSMYDGLIRAILPASLLETLTATSGFLVWLAYFLSVIPAILVSWGSYILGLHDKKLFFGHPPTTDR